MTDNLWLWIGFNAFVLGVTVVMLAAWVVASLMWPGNHGKPQLSAS